MRVVITGARGHLGRHLCERFSLLGWDVVAQVRGQPVPLFSVPPAHVVCGDLSDADAAQRAVEGADAVIHCAARVRGGTDADYQRDNVDATRALAQAASHAGVTRFVFISSIAVYGKRAHRLTDEQAPTEACDAYSRTKIAAEQVVLAHAPGPIVLRPGVLWGGPHDHGRVGRLAARLATGTCVFPGPCDAPGPLTHVDNLGDAIQLALTAQTDVRVFNITDDPPISLREFAHRLADSRRLGRPRAALPANAVLFGVGLLEDLRDRFLPRVPMVIRRDTVQLMNAECTFSLAAARRELGYAPVAREFVGATTIATRSR